MGRVLYQCFFRKNVSKMLWNNQFMLLSFNKILITHASGKKNPYIDLKIAVFSQYLRAYWILHVQGHKVVSSADKRQDIASSIIIWIHTVHVYWWKEVFPLKGSILVAQKEKPKHVIVNKTIDMWIFTCCVVFNKIWISCTENVQNASFKKALWQYYD